MNYTHEIVGTHGGALLPERAPGACSGAKPLVCIGLKIVELNMRLVLILRCSIHMIRRDSFSRHWS